MSNNIGPRGGCTLLIVNTVLSILGIGVLIWVCLI